MGTLPKNVVREIIKEQNFKSPSEVYSFLKESFKDVLQEMLEAEMDVTLGYSREEAQSKTTDNSRNGYSKKTVRSELGPIELNIPRDRKGEFEPKIVPKHKRDVSGIEEKVISLYARGLSTRDIHEQIKDIYGVEISAEMVSRITDHVVPEIKEWQNRPLEKIYPFVFMDAMHYKVRDNGQVINKAVYVVMGINLEGYKDILGIWIGENESSKFWLGVLNELKNRGIEDILLFCVDGLTGMKEAITLHSPMPKYKDVLYISYAIHLSMFRIRILKHFLKTLKQSIQLPARKQL